MDKEAADVLKHIADKLDLPVQQLWAGLVAYAPFTFYEWALTLALSAAGVIAFTILSVYVFRKSKPDDGPTVTFFVGFFAALFAFLSAVAFLDTTGHTADALSARYAPEAWASKYIVQRFR